MRALLLLTAALLAPLGLARALHMGVLGAAPESELLLRAAVRAALRGRAAAAAHDAPAEPAEPLAVPERVCAQARAGLALSVSEAGGADAAARAGLALLLVAPPRRRAASALELRPHPDELARACAELCAAMGWTGAVLLHEGSARAAPLLARDHERLALRARRLPPPHDDDALRNLLLVLKRWGATRFVVWCDAACAVRVLDAAQRAGLLGARHAFLLPALDLHARDLRAYSYGGANVTTLQLFDPEAEAVRRATSAWAEEYAELLEAAADAEQIAQTAARPPTAVLLAYDGALVAARAAARLQLPELPAGDCASGAAAFHADSLLNYIRSEEWSGATGALSWAAGGARRAVVLHAAELARGGRLAPAATWSARGGLLWRARPRPAPPPDDVMANRTFVVLVAQNAPYVMQQQSVHRLAGNARYEGFCIELIEKLSEVLGFNYTFVEAGKDYGELDRATGQWTGMIRRLMDDEGVHFAITDLTITAEREEAVDFTTPFMNLGIRILFRKPSKPEPALLAFLLPFSNGVWLCLGLAYVGTSLVLFVVGRLCPEEWQNPFPCVEEPPALQNQFTLANALWFNLGAVLLQGSEIAPAAYGSRAVASVWWLFALVVTSSYTANLATLLSTKLPNEIISGVHDLVDNELGIKYGAKNRGSTYKFFEQSNNELYQRMFQTMKTQKMPESNPEGLKMVLEGNYAYFAESTTIDYMTERNCDVTSVGEPLDSKGYGIAMKKNSPYRHALNLALLGLQERGELRDMQRRWWQEMHGGGACQEPDEPDAQKLKMSNFWGLFLVLLVGCALGVLLALLDLARAAWLRPRAGSFSASLLAELRFVFRFERSVKPARGPLTPPRDARSERSGLTGGSPARARSPSVRSRRASARRRSSMHAASARLARHAASPARLSPPRQTRS